MIKVFFLSLILSSILNAKDTLDIGKFQYDSIIFIFVFSLLLLIVLLLIIKEIKTIKTVIKSLQLNAKYLIASTIFNSTDDEIEAYKSQINLELSMVDNLKKTNIQAFSNKLIKENNQKNCNYFFITELVNEEITCQMMDIHREELDFKKLKYFSLENNKIAKSYFLRIPKNLFKLNFFLTFIENYSFLSNKISEYFLLFLIVVLPMIISFTYLIFSAYFIDVVQLFGIIPNDIMFDLSQFINYIFTKLLLVASIPVIGLYSLIPIAIVFIFFLIHKITYYFIHSDNNFVYKPIIIGLLTNVISYIIALIIIIVFLYKILCTIYKIEYPGNTFYPIENVQLYLGDYQLYTSKISMVEINKKFYYSVGHDSVFLYFYDLEENKNNMLINELSSINDNDEENRLSMCKNIILNIDRVNEVSKNEKDEKKAKLYSILISSTLLNTETIKKELIINLKKYNDRNVNWNKDLMIEDIINSCKTLVKTNFSDEQKSKILLANQQENKDEKKKLLLSILDEIIFQKSSK